MINELSYSAGLMSQSFWFAEFRDIIKLIVSGKTREEIEHICIDQNLFGMPNAYRIKRVYQYLIKRAGYLDDAMMSIFMNSDLRTQKLINLVAILRGDRLFFEFINEVYREKNIIGDLTIGREDMSAFFRRKESQSEVIATWNDSTKKHLRSNYLNSLEDAGMLIKEGRGYLITVPIVDIVLEQKLAADGEEDIVKALEGVS